MVVPVLAELAVLGVVDALRLRPAATLAIGVPLGAVVVAATTLRWALPARELAGLWRSLRGGPETGKTGSTPSGGVGVPRHRPRAPRLTSGGSCESNLAPRSSVAMGKWA